jgi:hypothetical protein
LKSKALPLIEEFIRTGVPQQRKNAVTALTVLGGTQSALMIARAALEDEDAGVRERALKEIAGLGRLGVRAALALFRRKMEGGSEVEQERAYAAVGYLRSRGAQMPPLKLRFGRLFRLAAAMNKHLYPNKSLEYRLRAWKPAALGSLAGGLFLFIATGTIFRYHEKNLIAFIIAVILVVVGGMVLAVSATQRTSPHGSHVNQGVALTVEVLGATCTGFLGILAFYAVISSLMTLPLEKNVATIGLLVLCAVSAGVTRAATALTFGFYRGRGWNWAAQVLAGTSAGFWVVTVVILAVALSDARLYSGDQFFLVVSSVPLAAACACAYASIDNTYPLAAVRRGIVGNVSRGLLVALILLIDLFLFFMVAVRVSR